MVVCSLVISLTGVYVCVNPTGFGLQVDDVDYMDFLTPYLAAVLVKTDKDLSA